MPAGTGSSWPEMRRLGRRATSTRAYPGSESAVEIAARVRTVLDAIADQHRGEAVLVVAHGGAIVATLAVLATSAGRPGTSPNCAYVALEHDADGWRLG